MCGSTVSGVRQLYVLGNKGYHEEDTPDFTGDKIDMVQATQRCSTKVTSVGPGSQALCTKRPRQQARAV